MLLNQGCYSEVVFERFFEVLVFFSVFLESGFLRVFLDSLVSGVTNACFRYGLFLNLQFGRKLHVTIFCRSFS